ncbi:ABC transporter permease subunit [Cytobacillus sp. FJAT-54145]|uniref:ABC transporter permease subunit n=1 Tax=Cytobacillus spartinae TaxID=3299023 RepID=A0ABW6KHW4_9BACI
MVVPPLPPSGDYWLGTDRAGRDLFSLIILGAKETLIIVVLITLVRFILGIPLGYFAARGNFIFTLFLRILQMLFSFFPILFLIMLVMAVPFLQHHDNRIYWMVLFLAIVELGRIAQIYREEFERVGQLEFVVAGISAGATKLGLFKNYYFPLLKKQTIIQVTNDLGRSLFLFSQLGFVSVFLSQEYIQDHLGNWKFQNTSLNWPVLLSNALNDIRSSVWIPFFVAACIALTILAFNFLGEALRRYFNSKRKVVSSEKVDEKITLLLERAKSKGIFSKKLVVASGGGAVIVLASTLLFLQQQNIIFKDEAVQVSAVENQEQVIENIAAFAKVYGYIRYFHPSQEADYLNWDQFAIYGSNYVRDAQNEKELRKKLEELFMPMAPTMKIYKVGQKEEIEILDLANNPNVKVAAFQHQGLGREIAYVERFNVSEEEEPSEPPLYNSQRIFASLDMKDMSQALFPHMPKKDEVFEAQISEEIMIKFPLTLYTENDGPTLGSSEQSRQKYFELTQDIGEDYLDKVTLEDNTAYVSNTILVWNQIQHFYPYFDDRILWDEQLKPAIKNALDAKNEKEFLLGLRKMIASIEDGQGEILPDQSGGKYVRFPFRVEVIEGKMVVTAAVPDSPIKSGDTILEIERTPAMDLIKEIAPVLSGTTHWRINKALEELTTRRRGTKVVVKWEHEGKTEAATVSLDQNFAVDPYGRDGSVKELEEGIFYVNLIGTKTEDIQPHIPTLANAKGIIFDIRGVPDLAMRELFSHLIVEPAKGAQFLIPQVIYPNYENVIWFNDQVEREWLLNPKEPNFKGKFAFLISEDTIAEGEAFLHYVIENKLGEVVGEQTAGATGLVNTSVLPGGVTFNWTGMLVKNREGVPSHKMGIPPNYPVVQTIEAIKAGRDEYIEKALEVLYQN